MCGRLTAAVLALGLLTAAGCGGDRSERYIDGFNEAQTSFQESLEGADFTDLTHDEAPQVLERTAEAAEETAAELEALDPPEEVRAHNREMVALLEEIRDLSREASEVLAGEIDEAAIQILSAIGRQLKLASTQALELTGEIAEELGTTVAD